MAIILGTKGANFLSSKKRGDIILGLDGDDTLVALHGFNILLGGDGDDRLTALSSFNILSGGDGDDSLAVLAGSGNVLHGGDGDDSLSVQSDGNTLDGGDGDDLFSKLGGSGNTVKGGAGRDTISYADATQGMAVSLAAGTGTGAGTLSGIENVTGGAGDDTIIGDANDNVLQGGSGNDTIEGGAGNDIVDGGPGDDLIIGGEGAGDDTYLGGDGNDTVSYASTSQGVAASLASGMATGVEIGTDTFIDIENIVGGTGNDVLTGDVNANLLDGGGGDDTIRGGAGDDILMGGEGFDTLLYDDSPTRVIVNMFNVSQIILGSDTVNPNSVLDGFGTTDAISGFENVIGSSFDDHIQGRSNVVNRLEGGAGNDLLAGSGENDTSTAAGADTLLGGAGNDVLRQTRGHDDIDGGADFDRLEFVNTGIGYGGSTGVSVNLAMETSNADTSNLTGGDVATINGIEFVRGTAGDDTLIGDALANRLEGQGGNDTIDGGGGADTLAGGAGVDHFRFGNAAANNTVTDFDGDILDFSPLFAAAGVVVPGGQDPLEWLVNEGYLSVDSTSNVIGGPASDSVVQVDLDGTAGAGTAYTVVTLMDVTLGTTGLDADNWLV